MFRLQYSNGCYCRGCWDWNMLTSSKFRIWVLNWNVGNELFEFVVCQVMWGVKIFSWTDMGVVGYAGIPSVVNSSLLFLAAGYGIWDCVPDILWYFGELNNIYNHQCSLCWIPNQEGETECLIILIPLKSLLSLYLVSGLGPLLIDYYLLENSSNSE